MRNKEEVRSLDEAKVRIKSILKSEKKKPPPLDVKPSRDIPTKTRKQPEQKTG